MKHTNECTKQILCYLCHGLFEEAVSQPQFDGAAGTCSYLLAKMCMFCVFPGLFKAKQDG